MVTQSKVSGIRFLGFKSYCNSEQWDDYGQVTEPFNASVSLLLKWK